MRRTGGGSIVIALALAWPAGGDAQFKTPKPIGEVPERPARAADEPGETSEDEASEAIETVEPSRRPRPAPSPAPTVTGPEIAPASPQAEPAPAAAAAPAPATTEAPVPILAPRHSEATILAAWRARQRGVADLDYRQAREKEAEIAQAREELAIENLFTLSAAMVRESGRLVSGDPVEALRRAEIAAALSPDLPAAHLAVARAAIAPGAGDVGRIAAALGEAALATARDERWREGVLLDLVAASIAALVVCTVLLVLVLFARHARYFFHDVNHLFPRGVSVLQTTLLAALVLAAPFVFRLGPFALLATLAVAAWMYLTTAERVATSLFVAVFAAVPILADHAVRRLSKDALADDVYAVERLGLEAPEAAARLLAVSRRDDAPAGVLVALGRSERRHGRFHVAVQLLTQAGEKLPQSAPVLVDLGNAQFLDGNIEGARASYAAALERQPGFAEALYNLSVVFARKARSPAPSASQDLERSRELTQKAAAASRSIARRLATAETEARANHLLASVPLAPEAVDSFRSRPAGAGRVAEHLRRRLLGAVPPELAPWAPPALLFGLWLQLALLRRLRPSLACQKCGRPVCRRCDHDIVGGRMCGQCVSVFAQRRTAVEPAARVAKEIGIRRYQRRTDGVERVAALVFAGAGHIWSGRTVRGVLFGLFFAFFAFNLAFRNGVVKPPFGADAAMLKVVPLALAIVLVYVLSLRGIFYGAARRA